MNVRRTLLFLAAIVVAMPVLRGGVQEPPKPGNRAEFMRQKLDLSKQLLEGLTRGDFDGVAGNAKKLKVLSEAAELSDPPPRDKKQYTFFLTNFRGNCDDLGRKAKTRELEGSTFAYIHIITNCIECHKLVRDQAGKE